MSKRVLTIVLAVLMAVTIWSLAARADVNGSFNFVIDMRPETTAGETSKMDFDVEAYLTLNAALSGLTIGTETVMGIAGPEHLILAISTTLGAVELTDQFVFAVPYYEVRSYYWDDWYYFDYMTPGRGMKEGVRRGGMLFVKKRVYSELVIGGLEFWNLFLLEDVTFPDPRSPNLFGDYTTDDQSWAVGDIVRISGTTVSGITYTSWTGFCADWAMTLYYPKHQLLKIFEWDYNLIKKKRWTDGTVEIDCYDEEQTKPLLPFSKEIIAVQGVPLWGAATMDYVGIFSTVDWKILSYPWVCPADGTWCRIPISHFFATIPFIHDLVFDVPIFEGVDVLIEVYSNNPLSLQLDAAVLSLVVGPGISVHWYDNDGDLSMTPEDDVVLKAALSIQDAVELNTFLWMIPTYGVQVFQLLSEVPVSWPNPHGTLSLLWTWEGWLTDQLELSYWSIAYATETEHTSVELKARYFISPTYAYHPSIIDFNGGLYDLSVNIGVYWDI